MKTRAQSRDKISDMQGTKSDSANALSDVSYLHNTDARTW